MCREVAQSLPEADWFANDRASFTVDNNHIDEDVHMLMCFLVEMKTDRIGHKLGYTVMKERS